MDDQYLATIFGNKSKKKESATIKFLMNAVDEIWKSINIKYLISTKINTYSAGRSFSKHLSCPAGVGQVFFLNMMTFIQVVGLCSAGYFFFINNS